MKTYCELYFEGTTLQLEEFVEQIGDYVSGEWKKQEKTERWKEYLFIDYIGTAVDKARVTIHLGDSLRKGKLKVVNIMPLVKKELSIDEYNAVLKKFNSDVIEQYRRSNPPIQISQISSDVFDPLTIITEEALKKLELFCSLANKSTGSSHPCDQERWFDFICQTVDDNQMFDYLTLFNFLQDESYWDEDPKRSMAGMGRLSWDEEKACELAEEYESACAILKYYIKTREF